jgi:hypothetical protein
VTTLEQTAWALMMAVVLVVIVVRVMGATAP